MMKRFLRWLIVIVVPLVLIMTAVRFFTLPWYPAWEYSRPNFPMDPLGMSDVERLRLAKECIRFLNSPYDSDILAELRYQDGSPVFNARELEHMDDVKIVYDRMTIFVGSLFLLTLILTGVTVRKGKSVEVYRSVSQGGVLTLIALIVIGLWMFTGFDAFFTAFHGVFFSEGTWLFSYTDALIRLFPIRFWQDAGTGIAILVVIVSLVLWRFEWLVDKFRNFRQSSQL
jgi:integral membrane protein (TIGR01906 family)